MRRIFGAALAAGVLCVGTGGAEAADDGTSASAELGRRLDAVVQAGIEARGYPGAVLIVGRPGEILHAKAYGAFTYDADAPAMALNTIFDLASVSKVVGTATAAMKLMEEGRLGLEDRVAKFIPGFGVGGKEDVTIRDLMTHVSGLRPYVAFSAAEKARRPDQSSADALIACIAALPASNPRGTTVTYSCLNMQTQARINETVLGGRMDDFLQEHFFGPLGMKDTTYRLSAERVKRTAPTSRGKNGASNAGSIHDPLANYHSSEEHCPGNAGLFSTALDLARYCEMILREGRAGSDGPRLLRPETVRLMTSLQTPPSLSNYRALGWDVQRNLPYSTPLNQTDETRVVTHTGYTGTMLWLDKLSGTYWVFLTNRTWPDDSKASSRGVTKARREIGLAVLASLPEYQGVDLSERDENKGGN